MTTVLLLLVSDKIFKNTKNVLTASIMYICVYVSFRIIIFNL